MSIYTNQKVAEYIEGCISIKVTLPILFEFLDYKDEISLIIEEPLLIKKFILHLSQIKEVRQIFQGKIQLQKKIKAQIIIEMIKLILEKNEINELNSVYVEQDRLNYFFNKVANQEGIQLLNQISQIRISWKQIKDNYIHSTLLMSSKIPDDLILESIQIDEVQLTAKLSKKLKKLLKSQQVKMIQNYNFEQSNQSIVKFLLSNLSDSDFKNDLVCETRFSILLKIPEKVQIAQVANYQQKDQLEAQNLLQNKLEEHNRDKLKLIYLNEICQQMILFPEILSELDIDLGILKVRNSYQLFTYLQKDHRLNSLNEKLKLGNLFDPFTSARQFFQSLKENGKKFNLQYINQDILIYTIISHLREQKKLVQLQLNAILQDSEFQQFYSKLSQVGEGTISKLTTECIKDIVELEKQQNIQLPQQGQHEQPQQYDSLTIQNSKQNEQVYRTLEYCLLNQMALPEIFKYFNYQIRELTIRSDQLSEFETQIQQFGFDNLNEFPLVKQSLFEKFVKMIELIQFQKGQIEQKRLDNFYKIIPDLFTYFNLFIYNQNDSNNFQNNLEGNTEYQNENENDKLAMKAIRLLKEIQQFSQDLPWQLIKKNYLIKILNYIAYIDLSLPQILGALHIVESELTLKVDKTLIKFLKLSEHYENPKPYPHHLQEKELIYKLLEILSRKIIDPDVQTQLEVQLQSSQVRNLYASLKQLKLKKYLQLFHQLYHNREKIPKGDYLKIIYRKIKLIYLHYISQNEIIVPELLKYIGIRNLKRSTDTIKICLNENSQLIEDLANNPNLSSLNDCCQISQLISKEVIIDNHKILDEFFAKQIAQIQCQLQGKLILDAITIIHRHHQSIIKDLHLIFQNGAVISAMDKLQNYFNSNSASDSYISKVYELLSQMKESVDKHFQNESKIIETPEFFQNLTNYNNPEIAMVLTYKTKMILNRNIRKVLYYMIQKQVVFPEFILFFQIIDKAKRYTLQLNKCAEFVNLIENNRKIQQFMNLCLNGEEALFQKIKLSDFDSLHTSKEIDNSLYEPYEQSSIISILQILFNQKEIHKDSLKYVFQQNAVQCLIYEMKKIYTQIPYKQRSLQQAYQILYDLNYWTQNTQGENLNSKCNSQQQYFLEQSQPQFYYIILYYIILFQIKQIQIQ